MPVLVQQLVAAHSVARGGKVLGQHATEKLPRPGQAADYSRTLAVREDRRVARRLAVHAAHSVQRVAALEQLEVTWPQREATDEMRAIAGQHGPNVVEVFRLRRPDV